ncbi:MAG: hypothetical protein LBJ04_07645 [Sphingobacterium sp.]|jgi:hypothetical protein|nr:hypothetical protein [Sphingobacterium sp.]
MIKHLLLAFPIHLKNLYSGLHYSTPQTAIAMKAKENSFWAITPDTFQKKLVCTDSPKRA